MKRASEETSALVYAYGCGAPIAGLEYAMEEHARQRAMWDALVRADRTADRALWDAAREQPEIDDLVATIDSLSTAIETAVKSRRAERAKVRAKVDTPELDAQIADLAAQRKTAQKDLWPLLAGWRKTHKDRVAAIESARYAEMKLIRQGSGLYWGNYDRVLESYETGRKLARKRGGRTRFTDPTRQDGVLTVRPRRSGSTLGATVDELMGGRFSTLHLGPVDPLAFDPQTPRGERGRLARTWVKLRVDAAGNFITLPLHLHRLPPDGARIKRAQLTWRREGERIRWQLALTCVSPAVTVAHPSPVACGIDIGWRLQPDGGLLVATTWDGSGTPTRYALPPDWMRGMDQVERLSEHVSDLTLELAKARHTTVADLPDDLRAPLMAWRPKLGAGHVDAQRLHDAIQARIAAVKGTADRADVPADLRAWYDRYRHLALWRDDLRAKLQRQRREHYRLIAREIATGYAVIGVEDIDLSEMARTKTRAPETGDNPLFAAARAQRVRAATHLLLEEVKHQAGKHGADLVTVKGPTTLWCAQCATKTGQRDRSARVWTCEHCGSVWDQDVNAARNIYDAALGASTPEIAQAA